MSSQFRRKTRSRSKFNFSGLPMEILPMIFKHLSVNERKAVKLVCRSWFEICNEPSLLKDEVLHCRGPYTMSDIFEFLDKSERRFLNLKFSQVLFFDEFYDDSTFWKNNGSRIRLVIFDRCSYNCFDLVNVIMHCENLIQLSILTNDYVKGFDESLKDDLKTVFRREIIREKLNYLEISFGSTKQEIEDDVLGLLFSIFPKVKILKIHLNFVLLQIYDEDGSILSLNLDYIKEYTDQIEDLKLHFHWEIFTEQTRLLLLEIFSALEKLTEVSADFIGLDLQDEDIDDFLDSNFEAPKLNISSAYYHCLDSLSSQFSFHMVLSNSCQKQLKTGPFNSRTVPKALCQNELEPFLQHSPNPIRHLHLLCGSHEDLQIMSEYPMQLKSLIVYISTMDYFRNKSEREVWGIVKNSFHQLKDVEYLELGCSISNFFLKCLSPRSVLTNMKYIPQDQTVGVFTQDQTVRRWSVTVFFLLGQHDGLSVEHSQTVPTVVSFSGLITHSDLLRLPDVVPFLEGLLIWVRYIDLPYRVCKQLCTKLSHLRYFRSKRTNIHSDANPHDVHKVQRECFQKLFPMCPSLRVLIYDQTLLFYDIITKKVRHECIPDYNYRYSFAEPKIGECVVDWLKF